MDVRPILESDWNATWPLMRDVLARGDTYAYPCDTTQQEAYQFWVASPTATYVAVDGGEILGTYYIKPNHPGQGAHVCNCGYMVAEHARGQGIATHLCRHSQVEALTLGFKAMQFNLVVATNAGAVRLWEKLGFDIVGTLPRAFNHPIHGFVDALIMYKWLAQEGSYHS